jgi:hypothetical protein
MAKYGFATLRIDFDDTAGTPQNMTSYILTFGGLDKEALLEEITAMGDSFAQWLATGISSAGDITLTGIYDDTAATGPIVVFGCPFTATTKTLKVTWGGGHYSSVETLIVGYKDEVVNKGVTKFTVVLRPTGVVTEV